MYRILFVIFLLITVISGCEINEETNSKKHMPVARFSIDPDTVLLGKTAYFNADSASDVEDPASTIRVQWSYTGNMEFTDITTSKTSSFVYTDVGPFFPKLVVTDSDEMHDTVTRMVIVVRDTANKSPYPAYIYSPKDFEGEVPYKNVTLKWAESLDKENDEIIYDVWFGMYVNKLSRLNYPVTYKVGKYPSPSIYGDRDIKIYEITIPLLKPNQDYFWSIGSRDPNGNYTLKNIWRFNTGSSQ